MKQKASCIGNRRWASRPAGNRPDMSSMTGLSKEVGLQYEDDLDEHLHLV